MVPAHLACRNLASVHPTCILAAEITQGVSQLGIPATVAVLLDSQQLPGRAEGSREDGAPGGLSDTFLLRLGVAVSVLWEPRQAQPGKHLGDLGVVFRGLEPRRSRSGASAAGVFCIAASLRIAAYLPKGSGLGESSKQQTTVV